MNKETKVYELEMKVNRKVMYKDESMFGIYGCHSVDYNTELIKNKYNNISLQGISFELQPNEIYKIKFEGVFNHKDYGAYYKIIKVYQKNMDTVDAHYAFLRNITTPIQYDTIKSVYPNEKIITLILEDKIDVNKTKGIKDKTLQDIKSKAVKNSNLFNLIAFLDELNISINKMDRILKHFNNDANKAIDMIQKNIYSLCDIDTFGFKTVDTIALQRGDKPDSKYRIQSGITYLLRDDNSKGHTWSLKSKVLEDASKLLNLDIGVIETTLVNSDSKLYYHNETQVALAYIRDIEIQIFHELNRIKNAYRRPYNLDIEESIKEIEANQGFAFTEEQKHVIEQSFNHGVMIVNGKGGVGKTAIVKALAKTYDTSEYMTCALSGKAANVLTKNDLESSTIHRMLGYQKGEFLYNKDFPLPYELIVMDEFSMNNVSLILSVLKAIPNGSKLIIVGDSGQLPAIGYGDVLRDLLATNHFAKSELTKVHRQAQDSGILSLANEIREGEQPLRYNAKGKFVFGNLQDQTVFAYSKEDKGNIVHDIVEICKSYKEHVNSPEDLYEFQVLVANKDRGDLSVRNLNIQLQQVFNSTFDDIFIKYNDYEFRINDKIITQGNYYKVKLLESIDEYYNNKPIEYDEFGNPIENYTPFYNGTLGYIYDIDYHNRVLFICLEGVKGYYAIESQDLNKIDLAYAITVHKSQGASIRNIIFALDFGSYTLLNKQLVYTALTRASKLGIALVETSALHKAIGTDASGDRRTFLQDIINGYHD